MSEAQVFLVLEAHLANVSSETSMFLNAGLTDALSHDILGFALH